MGSHGAEGVNETDVDGPRTDVADTTVYCSDTLARVVRTHSPLSVVHTQQFNDDSQTTQADSLGTESGANHTYQYDDKDNPTQATSPTGGNATMGYADSNNPHRPTTYTDQAGGGSTSPTWNYTYDDDGFLTQAKSAGAGTNITYRYCWDAAGNLQRLDPPDSSGNNQTSLQTGPPTGCGTASQGQDTLYSYNSTGLLQTVTPPAPQGQTSYTYDPLNRVQTQTDGRGVITTYTYDALNHVVGLAYSGSGSTSISRSYDADGNRLSVTDPSGTTSWTYDAFNRQSTQSAQSPAGSVAYTYDKAGDVTSITNANDPGPTTYTYDAADRVISVNDPRQAAANKVTIGYDVHGQRDEIDFSMADGHDLVEKYAYEDGGHLDCVFSYRANNAPTLNAKGCPDPTFSGLYTDHAYDYTGPGTIPTDTVYTMTQKNGQVTHYTYDDINRLTEAKTQLGSPVLRDFTYTYDYRSNMAKSIVTGTTPGLNTGTFARAFNNDNEICWYQTAASGNSCSNAPTGASSFIYNSSGDMTGATGGPFNGLSLSYNQPDQTSSITPAGSSTPVPMTYQGTTQDTRLSAGNTSMAYAKGNLDEQKSTGAGANTQWFLRLPDGTLIADITPQTVVIGDVEGWF